jgi:integrase
MVKRIRKKQSGWSHSNHEILNGKAQVIRTGASGDVWQFRMWIEAEQKYVRESLKTRDLDEALRKGEEKVFQILSDVSSGRKLFGTTLEGLCKAYVDWRQEDVDLGNITQGRLGTIKSQLKHFISFKSPDLKIAELSRESYYDYENWRRKTTPNTQKVTIRNEHATFNHMFAYGYREGMCHIDKLNFRKISVKGKDIGRRDIFSLEEYGKLVRYMRTYTSQKSCPVETEREERLLVRDCILVASNTMLRVGELWNLKWGDIKGFETTFDDKEQEVQLVKIKVRGEISKTGSSRSVVSRGGEYLKRIKSRAKYDSKTDYIFTEIDGAVKLSRKKYYLHWKNLMYGIGIEDYTTRKLTWYSLRHFGITCRLRSKVPIADIAKVAGTSSNHIENTYGHFDDDMLRDTALQNFSINKDGISWND